MDKKELKSAKTPKKTVTVKPPKSTVTVKPPKKTVTVKPPKKTVTVKPPKKRVTVKLPKKRVTSPKMKGGEPIPLYTVTSPDWHATNHIPYAVNLDVGINEYLFSRTTPDNKFVTATGLVNTNNGIEMVGGKKNTKNQNEKENKKNEKENKKTK